MISKPVKINHSVMNKIIDNNLKLELINDSHAKELFKQTDSNREYLRKWLSWVDVTLSVKDTEYYIQRSKLQYIENDGFQCIIKYGDKIAGMIGLVYIRNVSKKTEIGYWLCEDLQGKGIITKSCKSIIDHCFFTLNLNKIIIQCASENKASQGVPERLNFKIEGILKQDGFLHGKFVDHIRYAMLKEEWGLK